MKVGVLGGTFDPIHSGHLSVARLVESTFALGEVLFMISRNPPHKGSVGVSDSYHRFAMTVLATRNDARFRVSTMELNRPGPSYTVDTLRELDGARPKDSFCFIAGSDSLREIHLWRQCDKLFSEYCVVFVERPGFATDLDLIELRPELRKSIRVIDGSFKCSPEAGSSFLLKAHPPDVSSTSLRRKLSRGEEPAHWEIDPEVLGYSRKYHLYDQSQD